MTTMAVLLIAVLALGMFAGTARDRWEDESRQRLIDYFFMEAKRQNADENHGAVYELYKRAYSMDTTNSFIGSELALYYLSMGQRNQDLWSKGLSMMQRRFDEDPSDINNALIYGRMMAQLGRNDEALRVWQILDSLNPERKEVKLQYVDALIATSDSINLIEALRNIEKLETIVGPNVQLSSRNLVANIQLGDTAKALGNLHRLLIEAPLVADNYVYAAQVFQSLQMPDSVIKYLNHACDVDSTNGYAYYTRAEFYRMRNDSVAFRRETTHALLNTDLDLDVKREILLNYSREFYQDSTQFGAIDSLFRQVIDKHPHEFIFHDLYSDLLAAVNKYPEAAEQAELALDIDPSDPKQWHSAIILYVLADEPEKAIETGSRAVTYHPTDGDLMEVYASALSTADRNDEALQAALKAVELTDSLDKTLLANRLAYVGDIYHRLNDNPNAYATYEKALELDPANLLVMNNMAYFFAVDGIELDRAERLSAFTLREQPTNATWLDTYAWILFKQCNFGKAKEYIDRALEHDDNPTYEIYEHAGDIYFHVGDIDRAVEFWTNALELDSGNERLERKIEHRTYFKD